MVSFAIVLSHISYLLFSTSRNSKQSCPGSAPTFHRRSDIRLPETVQVGGWLSGMELQRGHAMAPEEQAKENNTEATTETLSPISLIYRSKLIRPH